MRFKKTTWYNMKTDSANYGIKIKYANLKFLDVAENGKPLIFETELERDEKIKQIKRDSKAKDFESRMKFVRAI
jgi:hypothetical protein